MVRYGEVGKRVQRLLFTAILLEPPWFRNPVEQFGWQIWDLMDIS